MALTEKQTKVLQFIQKFTEKEGYGPSQREIAEHFGFASLGTVQDYLKALQERGALQRSHYSKRNLTVIENERNIPLLGHVAAGAPIDYSIHDQSVEVPSTMLRRPGEHFALRVKGDSMMNIGIMENDIVVVHRQEDAANGDVVVAMINNEATIKRLQKKRGTVELISENPKYKPIVVTPEEDFRIVGTFAGLMRLQ